MYGDNKSVVLLLPPLIPLVIIPLPVVVFPGLLPVLKVVTYGATVTVVLAVTLPPLLVAKSVYVVVEPGLTV